MRCPILKVLSSVSYYSFPIFGRHSWLPTWLSSSLTESSFVQASRCNMLSLRGCERRLRCYSWQSCSHLAHIGLEVAVWLGSGAWDLLESQEGACRKDILPYSSLIKKREVQRNMYTSLSPRSTFPALWTFLCGDVLWNCCSHCATMMGGCQ